MKISFKNIWETIIVTIVIIIILIITSPFLVLILIASPILFIGNRIETNRLYRQFNSKFRDKGIFIIFIYSNSPKWKNYVEENILPIVSPYSVILNWSERKKWKKYKQLEVEFFYRYKEDRAYNPLAIIVTKSKKVDTIKFYKPFINYKHGLPGMLQSKIEILKSYIKNKEDYL